jgi:hypothetical protein
LKGVFFTIHFYQMILKFTLPFILLSFVACSQNNSDEVLGEWTLEMSDDGDWYPDVLYLDQIISIWFITILILWANLAVHQTLILCWIIKL